MNPQLIEVPGAPPVPGLRFRRFDVERDYAPMADVLNAAAEADGLESLWTADVARHMDSWLRDFDPPRDRVVAEVDGAMVGAGRVGCERNVEGERLYMHSFNLAPAWRRLGIGTAVLRHSERRLCERASGDPDDGPKYFQPWPAADSQVGMEALFRNEGYQPVRYSYDMIRPDLRDIPELPLPPGLETRPIEPQHLRQIWDAKEEAFSDLWGFIPSNERGFVAWCSDPFWVRDLSRVAWDGDQVVGQVQVFISADDNRKQNRLRGYTEMIWVRRPWRRRGVARALIVQCLRALREAGMTEAALSVDTANPSGALGVYESLGYRPERKRTWYRKPLA